MEIQVKKSMPIYSSEGSNIMVKFDPNCNRWDLIETNLKRSILQCSYSLTNDDMDFVIVATDQIREMARDDGEEKSTDLATMFHAAGGKQ